MAIDFILAVGGGSVCDYAKAVSISVFCKEDPWEKYYLRMEDVDNEIIPVGCVLTMVGTGSEMNGGSVITNHATKLKIGHVFGENVFPKFSILNPTYTFTLPKYQMTAGFFDIMSHMLGQAVGAYTDATHGMTLSAVSMAYYRHIMSFGLSKFKRFATNVWDVNPDGKTEEETALEGLAKMESYMTSLDLVMNIKDLGVTEEMIEGLVKATFIMEGGYKVLSPEETEQIFRASM